MSANGSVSASIDYGFFGGGYIRVKGSVDSTFSLSSDITGYVPIVGEISNLDIPFTFTSEAGKDPIRGYAYGVINFSGSGTGKLGDTIYGELNYPWIYFTGSATGKNVTHGYFDNTLEFSSASRAAQFEDADTAGRITFSLSSIALNYTTLAKSRVGQNFSRVIDNTNNTRIDNPINDVFIRSDGSNIVTIIQK